MTRYLLAASTLFVKNRQSDALLKEIKRSYRLQFGRMNIPTLFTSLLVVLFSVKEYLRCRLIGDLRAPKTSYLPLYKRHELKEQWAMSSYTQVVSPKIPYSWIQHPEPNVCQARNTALASAIHLQDFNG